jgi:hypothetical protein
MFQYIRRWLLHFYIDRELKHNKRVKKHVDFKEVRTLGVLFLLENELKFNQIEGLVKKLAGQGKAVRLIGLFEKKMLPNFFIPKLKIDILTKKDIGFFGFPKGEIVNDFIEKPFDLLLDFTESESLAMDYILGLSRAGFKAGRYRDDMVKVLDLMIKKPEKMGLDEFINTMIDYISIFNTKSV